MPATRTSRSQGGCGAAATMVVCVTAAGAAHAEVPALEINWSVNGGPVNAALPSGEGNGESSYTYEGVLTDAATGLELGYDLKADPTTTISGNVNILNDLDEAIEVVVEIRLPASAPFANGSWLAGQGVVGLTTGPGGGQISSLPPALWQALTDGSAVGTAASLFADPFFLSHPGATSSGTSGEFGSPDPVPGPVIDTSFGFELGFALTAHDRASITSSLLVHGPPCPDDLDGDGAVAIGDVIELLAQWGACPAGSEPCPGDLDGDGVVGTTDFLALLAVWGPCP